MKLKDKLSEQHLLLFLKMTPYMLHEYWNFAKHVARCGMSKNSNKLLTDILMTTHAVEKAFSLDNKRKGFGVKKIVSLTSNIQKYIKKTAIKKFQKYYLGKIFLYLIIFMLTNLI